MSIVLAGVVVAISLFASEPAAIGDLVDANDTQTTATKALVVCERDEASRRAFKRQYGSVSYVTAKEVIDSRGDGEAWATPRCITPSEFVKLRKLTDLSYAQVASR
jgi:hypothetical protein